MHQRLAQQDHAQKRVEEKLAACNGDISAPPVQRERSENWNK